ncbi:hypothetical protein WN943_013546 [Citrus x changshan-huyou]
MHCIRSSHGWLKLLDHERACPFLLNPFSDIVGYYPEGDGEEGHHVLDRWNSKHGEGGDFVWKNFNGECQGGYSDVICTADNLVYALSTSINDNTGFTVEGWDFKQQAPSKLMQVTASLPRQLILRSMFITSYLVESLGDIWLVVRKIWVPSKRIHFTTQFSVFKLDFQLRQWIDVHNRSDCVFAETLKIEPPPIWVALTFN